MGYQYFYHTMSKDATLARNHYSDPHYDGGGAVIFGKESDRLCYEYADRLAQWDREKHDTAWEIVKESGKDRTARGIEIYLQNYYDDPELKLFSIRTGRRPFDGYPWFLYGFVPGNTTYNEDDEIEHTNGRNRSTSCSLFALSVILFNVTACLIIWWFILGR